MSRPWMGEIQGDGAMNGFAVVLCMSVLGVQQTWRTTPEGELEYVLQVEPTFLASLERGDSITSDLPASAKEVHRLCLRISAGDLKKAQQWKLDLPPIASAQERADRSEPDIPMAKIVDSNGAALETTDVSHGWQAGADGRVKYVVQLSPDMLIKLQDGDEIYMNLYPEARHIAQFIVTAGRDVLPRKSAKAPAHATLSSKNPRTVAPAAAEKENPPIYGPVTGRPAAERPAAGSHLFERRGSEPAKLRSPSRYSVTDDTTEPPEQPADDQPLYGPREDFNREGAPELITETPPEENMPEEEPLQSPFGAAKRGPRTPPPREAAEAVPEFDGREFNQDQFASAPVNKPRISPAAFPKTARGAIAPPEYENENLPEKEARSSETRNSPRHHSFGTAEGAVATASGEENREGIDNRTASIPPRAKPSLSAAEQEPVRGSAATAKPAQPEATLGMWAFVCCALFLSIGGNLYLGWTTAEFYQRYRQVLERSRGGSRSSDED